MYAIKAGLAGGRMEGKTVWPWHGQYPSTTTTGDNKSHEGKHCLLSAEGDLC
jgi:hypothetical protein